MNDQKVAGYYRVSVARDDMKAPELYQDEIERYCNYRSLELFEVFSDVDHSGTEAPNHARPLKSSRGDGSSFRASSSPSCRALAAR